MTTIKPTRGPGTAEVLMVGVVGLLVCGFLSFWWFSSMPPVSEAAREGAGAGKVAAAVYDPPANGIEEALNKGDGQIFAALATDPLAQETEIIRGGSEEQAYRYQRPVYGWIGWIGSGGQTDSVAWALIAATAVSGALLVAAGAHFLRSRSVDPRWALLLLFAPGLVIDLTWIGPEALGMALVVFGLTRWPLTERQRAATGRRPDVVAILLFAAAGLCRETLLLIPFVLMVSDLVRRRFGWALGAALSAAPYVAWVLYLRLQIGAWPKGSVGGRLSLIPFGGMAEASSGWGQGDIFVAVFVLTLAVAALIWDRTSGLRPLVAANFAFAALLGEAVWGRFPDYSRVLLPLTVLSMLGLLVARKATVPAIDSELVAVEVDDVPLPQLG